VAKLLKCVGIAILVLSTITAGSASAGFKSPKYLKGTHKYGKPPKKPAKHPLIDHVMEHFQH